MGTQGLIAAIDARAISPKFQTISNSQVLRFWSILG